MRDRHEPLRRDAPARATHRYDARRVALLTQHGKESIVGPVLARALHCRVERVSGYDTDRLGTFTGETAREGSQLDAARRKARIGMDLSGFPLGIGSEGSFGSDPVTGLLPWNRELIVWIDAEQQLEVVGTAQGDAAFANLLATRWSEVDAFAKRLGFPSHHIVIRPDGPGQQPVRKGIDDAKALREAFGWAVARSSNAAARVETDLRAHANPTRQEMIRRAALDLAARLVCACPQCGVPGFGVIGHVSGLACSECGAPTAMACADLLACPKCGHRTTRERSDGALADPTFCDNCNP